MQRFKKPRACYGIWVHGYYKMSCSFSVPVPVNFGWLNNEMHVLLLILCFSFRLNEMLSVGERIRIFIASICCFFFFSSSFSLVCFVYSYVRNFPSKTHWLATDHSFQTIFKCIRCIKIREPIMICSEITQREMRWAIRETMMTKNTNTTNAHNWREQQEESGFLWLKSIKIVTMMKWND